MVKAIIFTRVSTERQSLDEQLLELKQFAISQSYKESELLIIEGAGASAIKLNDAYLDMISKVKQAINDNPTIEVVFLWALDRFGRNDEILIKMKNWFVDNKINLIIKNPHLVLLNPDKTLNSGTELTYNVLATIAKQEMQSKFDRFKRSKQHNKKIGKYNGGIIPIGYIVDKDGFFQVDPNNYIHKIFTMYATGNYSYGDIVKELHSIGYFQNQTHYIAVQRIHQILHNKIYIGQSSVSDRFYPAIISEELFNKCHEIGKTHAKQTKQHKKNNDKTYPCKGLVKCAKCGLSMVVHTTSASYVCNNHYTSTSLNMIESVTWWAISPLYASFLLHKNAHRDVKSLEAIELLSTKIKVLEAQQNELNKRIDIITEKAYLEAKISIEKADQMIATLKSQISSNNKELTSLKEQQTTLMNLYKKPSSEFNISKVSDIFNITDPTTRYDILHEFVESIVPEKLHGYTVKLTITLKDQTTLSYIMHTKMHTITTEDNKVITAKEFNYTEFVKRTTYK